MVHLPPPRRAARRRFGLVSLGVQPREQPVCKATGLNNTPPPNTAASETASRKMSRKESHVLGQRGLTSEPDGKQRLWIERGDPRRRGHVTGRKLRSQHFLNVRIVDEPLRTAIAVPNLQQNPTNQPTDFGSDTVRIAIPWYGCRQCTSGRSAPRGVTAIHGAANPQRTTWCGSNA
jgi:hypothetical protein